MSLIDSPAFHLSHSSFLRTADNPGRPGLAMPIPPIRPTQKTLPCCTDRLNLPPVSFEEAERGKKEGRFPSSAAVVAGGVEEGKVLVGAVRNACALLESVLGSLPPPEELRKLLERLFSGESLYLYVR